MNRSPFADIPESIHRGRGRPRLTAAEFFEREPAPRAPRRKAKSWRVLVDGNPSSDGIQADIAAACRRMFGAPGICNADGVLWFCIEQRGAHSRGGHQILAARGVIPGTPEFVLLHRDRVFFGEVKRPGESFTPAQLAVHPQMERAGWPVFTWRSAPEFIAWAQAQQIPQQRPAA